MLLCIVSAVCEQPDPKSVADPSSWTRPRGPELVDPTLWTRSQEPVLVDESPDPQTGSPPELMPLYLLSSFSPKLFKVLLPRCNWFVFLFSATAGKFVQIIIIKDDVTACGFAVLT